MVGPSVSERYRSDGIGEVHGGRTPSHHLGDTMNGKASILLSGLVAILMVTCAIPFMASEDSDALTGNSPGMALNKDSAVIYTTGTPTSVDLWIASTPTGVSPSGAVWTLHDLDDGTTFVSLINNNDGTYTVAAGTLPQGKTVATIEIVVTITVGDTTYTASAVIVVYLSASTPATSFHYYFKIDSTAYNYLVSNYIIDGATLPSGYDISDFNTGFWVTVTKTQTGLSDANFNALTALQWYFTQNGWSNHFSNYGWIEDLLGLESYPGSGGVWYYWAQYHAVSGSPDDWAFNNTTLEFITTAGESYIGMIFWGSPDASTMPSFPGYPTA